MSFCDMPIDLTGCWPVFGRVFGERKLLQAGYHETFGGGARGTASTVTFSGYMVRRTLRIFRHPLAVPGSSFFDFGPFAAHYHVYAVTPPQQDQALGQNVTLWTVHPDILGSHPKPLLPYLAEIR
jgi:hypothetical protein